MLRIIADQEEISGESKLGYNVNMAFYAQHQLEALHLNQEILEELKQCGSGKSELELRNLLGCFLFTNDDVFKKIKVLSGGEKSRVALAKTLISESNFLLLDEPTNHLDMLSVQILIQALDQFQGTFVAVSHDRHFISHVANKIWYIEGRQLKVYPGNYQEYEYWRSRLDQKIVNPKPEVAKTVKIKKEKVTVKEDKRSKGLQQNLKLVEEQIENLESKKKQLEAQLSEPGVYGNPDTLKETSELFQENESNLNRLNQEWEGIATELEALQA